jgi:hypothetical protein
MTTAELTTQALLPKNEQLTRVRVIEALRRWHDDEQHTGSLEHCYEQPCHALYRAADEGEEDHGMCLSLSHDCSEDCEHDCGYCSKTRVCPDQAKHDADREKRLAEYRKNRPDVSAKPAGQRLISPANR